MSGGGSGGGTTGRAGRDNDHRLGHAFGTLVIGLWVLALGYLAFFGFGLLIGAVPANRLPVGAAIAAVIAILFAIRSTRVNHVLRDHSSPEHEELMRDAHRQRQLRGF